MIRENTIHTIDEKLFKPVRKKTVTKIDFIRRVIRQTLIESTCHGLPKFAMSKSFVIKYTWLLTAFVFTGICSYFIIEEVFSYFSYQVNSHTKKFYEMPTVFPTVTICNKNMYTTEHAHNFVERTLAENNLTIETYFKTSHHMDIYATSLNRNYSNAFRKKLGKSINEFILFCKYDDEFCNLTQNFIWVYDKNYGNCFKFNHDLHKPKMSTFSGKFYGLILTLDVDILKDLKIFSQNMGAVIKLENGSNELDLPISFETNIVVDRVYAKQLLSPYSLCFFENGEWPKSFNTDLYDIFLKYGIPYNQKDCIELCYQNLAISYCSCLDRQSIFLPSWDYCYKSDDVKCLIRAYERFKQDGNSYVHDKCVSSCPLECNSTSFQMSSSFSQITLNAASTVRVNIFYESLSYIEISETEAKSAIDLISEIGGIMGLFLGLSFMSFMEFFEMLFRILLILIRNQNDFDNI